MLVRKVDEACDFVARFCRTDLSYPWKDPPPDGLPAPLFRLGERLGGIWDGKDHPYFARGLEWLRNQTLFTIQDVFFDPRKQHPNGRNISMFWEENQGVCVFGCKPDDPRVFVEGDWTKGEPTSDWRPMKDTSLEEALIWSLMRNLFFMAITEEELQTRSHPRPSDLDVLVWRHDAFDFDLWTDEEESRIYMAMPIAQTAGSPGL